MCRKITIVLSFLFLSLYAYAQLPESNARFSVSTDAVTWANFGTANLGISVAADKHFSVHAEAQYNPWTFNFKRGQMQNRKQQYSISTKWWPWHVYSGWWLGAGLQYQEYNHGGVVSQITEEGDATGLALSCGYTLMLTPVLNLDFGFGAWGGYKWYTKYSCPKCGRIIDQGKKFFFTGNYISIAMVLIF